MSDEWNHDLSQLKWLGQVTNLPPSSLDVSLPRGRVPKSPVTGTPWVGPKRIYFGYRVVRINALQIEVRNPVEIWVLNPQIIDDGVLHHEGLYRRDGTMYHPSDSDATIISYVWPEIREELLNA